MIFFFSPSNFFKLITLKITAYIELPEGYNVSLIDINTVKLIYNDHEFPAVNDTRYDFVTDPEEYLTDEDEDGIIERMAKFVREDLQAILEVGDEEIKVTGEVAGMPFEGYDVARVIGKGR
jgi:hypothetical protein